VTVRRLTKRLDALEAVALPPGFLLSTLKQGEERQVHALLKRGYSAGGGTVPEFAEWWGAVVADPEFDPALVFVVREGGGPIIAAAHCWTSAFVKDLAVEEGWRRRGIARALLFHVFSAFRNRGAASVSLKVQTDNPSGAQHLYANLGMYKD
jgi:ribosomal protein S18 acetylase RimI-like enzyme